MKVNAGLVMWREFQKWEQKVVQKLCVIEVLLEQISNSTTVYIQYSISIIRMLRGKFQIFVLKENITSWRFISYF
jgi:hypothetical protein